VNVGREMIVASDVWIAACLRMSYRVQLAPVLLRALSGSTAGKPGAEDEEFQQLV